MKKYNCKFSLITKSRCGSYIYNCNEIFDVPEDCVSIKQYLIQKIKDSQKSFKRCQISIKSIDEAVSY